MGSQSGWYHYHMAFGAVKEVSYLGTLQFIHLGMCAPLENTLRAFPVLFKSTFKPLPSVLLFTVIVIHHTH